MRYHAPSRGWPPLLQLCARQNRRRIEYWTSRRKVGDQIDGDNLDALQSPGCATVSGFSVRVGRPGRARANFQRVVRRKNEEICWAGCERNRGLFSLASAGRIVGISDVSQGHGIDIKPYVLGTYTGATGLDGSSPYKANEGIDVSYNLTPQLRAILTVDTDFAQTEVDDRQVSLTRFPLFFPEKRDFFLRAPATSLFP